MPETVNLPIPNGYTKAQVLQMIALAEDYEANKTYNVVDDNGEPVLDEEGNQTTAEYTVERYALKKIGEINLSYFKKQLIKYQEKQIQPPEIDITGLQAT